MMFAEFVVDDRRFPCGVVAQWELRLPAASLAPFRLFLPPLAFPLAPPADVAGSPAPHIARRSPAAASRRSPAAVLATPTRVSETAAGHWLIPEKLGYRVTEYDPASGATVRTFRTGRNPANPKRGKFFLPGAERPPDGTTMIADGVNNRVMKMDASGDVGAGGVQTCPGASVTGWGRPLAALLMEIVNARRVGSGPFGRRPWRSTGRRGIGRGA